MCGCANLGPTESEYNLGVAAYRMKDYASARQHWTKAIKEDGDTTARNNLGYLLYYGLGGDADKARAISLWTQAAQTGDRESQWHLGQAFEDGKALEQSFIKAYAWYRCAAEGVKSASVSEDLDATIAQDASKSLIQLLPKLSPGEFESAEKLAKLYIANYSKANAN
jgi:TPR repeat protein